MSEAEKELLLECVHWMMPFAEIVREKNSPKKTTQVDYTIQSHHGHLALLVSTDFPFLSSPNYWNHFRTKYIYE